MVEVLTNNRKDFQEIVDCQLTLSESVICSL
jgi:hypothetical protein